MRKVDYLVIGGGIAGATAGYALAEHGRVVVLERESQAGYHTTGRSAALYTEAYGNAAVRAITAASRAFFEAPPAGFADHPLLTARGALFIGRVDQLSTLEAEAQTARRLVPTVSLLGARDTCALVPLLRPDYVAGGVLEPDARDMDVHAIHQGFLKGLRARGGELVVNAEATGLALVAGDWEVETKAGRFGAPVVVNAAGAWCDEVAALAGAGPIGLVPKRRTAFLFRPPATVDIDRWPMVCDVDEQFYFKPDAGNILASPADETPSPPCDAQPEELDIALAVERIQAAANLPIQRIAHRWAGLRSFVADKTFVVGFDPGAPGFFWFAGQGGYGIQTSPAMGRIAADLARGLSLPSDVADLGVSEAALSPARFRAG
jgi:D-arginine dehydrogenase